MPVLHIESMCGKFAGIGSPRSVETTERGEPDDNGKLNCLLIQFLPVCGIHKIGIAGLVGSLEMDVAILGDVDNIAGVAADDPAINLNLQRSINDEIVLVIGQRPLKAGVIQFHDAASHAGSLFQGHDILQGDALLSERLALDRGGLDADDAAGIHMLFKIILGFTSGGSLNHLCHDLSNQFFTDIHSLSKGPWPVRFGK